MGFMDKFTGLLKGEEEEVYEDDEQVYEDEVEEEAPVSRPATSAKSTGGISSGISLEMKVVKPERFDEVQMIGEHLLAKRSVILNLEDTNKETTKRIIDFLGGVVFAIQGKVRKVANATYIVTPKNVEVSSDAAEQPVDEQPAAPKNRDFFN